MGEGDYNKAYQAHIRRWGVGATLRGAREAGGETIAEVARATRIRAEYLYALENEEYHALPGWAYALSYVRTYADYLGLEPLPLVRKVREQVELRQHVGRNPARREPAARNWRPAAVIVLAICAVLAGGIYYTGSATVIAQVFEPVPRALKRAIDKTFFTVADTQESGGQDEVLALSAGTAGEAEAGASAAAARSRAIQSRPEAPSTTAAFSQAVPAPGPEPEAIEERSGIRFAPLRDPSPLSDKVLIATHPALSQDRIAMPEVTDVVIRARSPCFMTVEDAVGRTLFSQKLAAGELYRLPTGAGFTVTSDDAGALEVYVQGALAGQIGPPGSPVTKLPVDSLTGVTADG